MVHEGCRNVESVRKGYRLPSLPLRQNDADCFYAHSSMVENTTRQLPMCANFIRTVSTESPHRAAKKPVVDVRLCDGVRGGARERSVNRPQFGGCAVRANEINYSCHDAERQSLDQPNSRVVSTNHAYKFEGRWSREPYTRSPILCPEQKKEIMYETNNQRFVDLRTHLPMEKLHARRVEM